MKKEDIDRILDNVIDNIEVVINYKESGLLVNWKEVLVKQCENLMVIKNDNSSVG